MSSMASIEIAHFQNRHLFSFFQGLLPNSCHVLTESRTATEVWLWFYSPDNQIHADYRTGILNLIDSDCQN